MTTTAENLLLDPNAGDQSLLNQVLAFYQRRLRENEKAQAYLSKRGIHDPEAIERFKIGYADRQLGLSLPSKDSTQGKQLRSRLQELGIFRSTGHGHFNGCLVFPVSGADGRISEIYGRKIGSRLRANTELHLYLRQGEAGRGIWNADALKETEDIILCHSIIEALTFWCAGYRNVTAAYGITGFTEDHVTAFRDNRPRSVLIAYGNTDAANAAAQAVAQRLRAAGLHATRIEYPKGQDANDVARQADDPRGALEKRLADAGQLQAKPKPTKDGPSDAAALCGMPAEPVPAEPVAEPEPTKDGNDRPESLDQGETADRRSPPPASGLQPPASGLQLQACEDGSVVFGMCDRTYRIRGLQRNMSPMQLRVSILATRDGLVHQDALDLVKARSRAAFIKATASELYVDEQVVKKDVGTLLLQLEQLRTAQIESATAINETKVELTPAQRRAATEFLRSPDLVARILADYDTCGLVGEATNKLVAYLACVSRRLERPLAVLIQSGSAAGKTSLMEATLAFVPEEDQVGYSAMTAQSLYYMGRQNLKHKILAVAEEEGVAQASYALKLLQSDGRLRIAAAGKNNGTGRQQTESYEVEGPVMMFLTTTAEQPDMELQNRCLTLHVNESPDHTAAIHARQRAAYTINGQSAARQRERILQLHQNAQRLLEPLPVIIVWADQLSFRHDQTRMRRDHAKYLSLIASITLLHQHQRPKKTRTVDGEAVEYLEATFEDAELANRLASEVMGHSLDALLPQTRQLLTRIHDHVTQRARHEGKQPSRIRFTQRELRESFRWGDYQLRRHLARLVELEYVLTYRTGAKNQREYELLYDGQGRDGQPFLLGLTDATTLKANRDVAHQR